MKTVKCTHCGTETNNQPPGDGCHACCRGTMREIQSTQQEGVGLSPKDNSSVINEVKNTGGEG